MGNPRILLYVTLFFIVYLIWAQWQMQHGPQSENKQPTASSQTQTTAGVDVPHPDQKPSDTVTPEQQPATIAAEHGQLIHVVTDLMDVTIDTRGGTVISDVLHDYVVDPEKPDDHISLLNDTAVNYQVAQSGLVSSVKGAAPTHNAIYKSEKDEYRLAEGKDTLSVPLYWTGPQGEKITKTLVFKRGEYVIDVNYKITAGKQGWKGSDYMQLVKTKPVKSGNKFIHTYNGGVVYNKEIKYEKYSYDDIEEKNMNYKLDNGWLAMIQHHFLVAWIPEQRKDNYYYSRYNAQKGLYTLGVRSSSITIKPDETAEISSRLVVGPKLQYKLEKIAPGLELTVDYGILTIIAKPLFWLLNEYDKLFNNWGWAIIFLTLTVKLVLFKLSEMSYRSMAKMRKVAPRIQAMKEKFGDDRQAMSKAMMDLYKREKINPMGGCLPIVIQMPVFISLYWVLLESVEMRHAPFIFWIHNLTAKDPYFILPVIMGISMFLQQKLNPAPIDPMQQKIFQIMPFAFTFMFAFFPSGLVLYWVVNNILSIAQQYIITKRVESGAS